MMLLLACVVLPFVTSTALLDQSLLPKFIALSILLCIAAFSIGFNKKSTVVFSIIDFLFVAYVFWQVLSVSWAFNFAEAVFSASTTVLFFLSYQIIKWTFFNNENLERFLLLTFAFTAFILTLYAWYEFFTSAEADGSNKMVYAVAGFSAHKNLFVLQLFLYLPFLIIGYLKSINNFKYFYLGSATLILLLLISLLARAFMVGLLVTIFTGLFLWFISRGNKKSSFNWKPYAIALPLLLLIIIGIFSMRGGVQMLNRYNVFNFKESRNAQERIVLWGNTLELIKEKPILGLGAGNWDVFFPSTGIQDIKRMSNLGKTVSRPHNDYLWITAETGAIGISLYLCLLVAIYFISIKTILLLKDDHSVKKKIIILLSFLTGYLVIAFFDFPKERIELNFMVAMLMAYIVYYIQEKPDIKWSVNIKGIASRSFAFTIFGILCVLLYVSIVRYESEQKTAELRKDFYAKRFDKILQQPPNIKNILFNIDPTEIPVKYYECNAHFNKKDYQKAVEYGKEAILDSPYHVNTLKSIAAAYGALAQFEKAIPYFEKVLQINPNDEQNKEGLVMCYYNSDQKEKTKALLKTLKVSENDHPSIIEMRKIFGLN